MKTHCECCKKRGIESEAYEFESALVQKKNGPCQVTPGGILIPNFKARLKFKCLNCNCAWTEEVSKKEYEELLERSVKLA